MEVAIEFKLPIRVRKKGKWFISSCPVLDVFSQGPTRAEAEQNLTDALHSFLISCYEAETLEKVLHEAGFVSSPITRSTHSPNGTSCVSVVLPFRIKASSNRISVP
jgi:predicted RNase H-like HicB family nuclease